jgi:hypothetical protein
LAVCEDEFLGMAGHGGVEIVLFFSRIILTAQAVSLRIVGKVPCHHNIRHPQGGNYEFEQFEFAVL